MNRIGKDVICDLCGKRTRGFGLVTSKTVVCRRCAEVIHDRHANSPLAEALLPAMAVGHLPNVAPPASAENKREALRAIGERKTPA